MAQLGTRGWAIPPSVFLVVEEPARDVRGECALSVEVVTAEGVNTHLPVQRDPRLWPPGPALYPADERDRIFAAGQRGGCSGELPDGRRWAAVCATVMFPKGPAGDFLPTRLRPAGLGPVPAELAALLPADLPAAQRSGVGAGQTVVVGGSLDVSATDAPSPDPW